MSRTMPAELLKPVGGGQACGPVLLTGASGYLGAFLAQRLRGRGYEVRALLRRDSPGRVEKARRLEDLGIEVFEGDLLSPDSLGRACRGMHAVLHAAAQRGAWSREHNHQFHVNVDGTAALMRAALAAKVARVVHVSSLAAVGATRVPRALDEGEAWSFSKMPRVHYVLTKREAEERVLHALRNGLPAMVVNPGPMIGRAVGGGQQPVMIQGAIDGRPRRVPTGGDSLVHVEDVAESIVTALERGRIGERYILGGANLSWVEFHEAVARLRGRARRVGSWPVSLGRVLASAALVLDGVGLSRPAWAPERFRAWGWYRFADSSKARDELGHQVPECDELLRRALD